MLAILCYQFTNNIKICNMNTSFLNLVLILHILSGTVGLVSGTFAMCLKKNNNLHKIIGKTFFYALAGVFVTSVYMSVAKNNIFLLMVGFFSFYTAATGYRILFLKKLNSGKISPKFIDYVIGITGLLAGLAMLVLAVLLFLKANMFGFVCITFGGISTIMGYKDLSKFKYPPTQKLHWIESHGMRMAGAYTATVTAFIVVNIDSPWQWVFWILPTFIIIPIAKRIINRFTKKSFKSISIATV
jgi:uncharacterized membrane protein